MSRLSIYDAAGFGLDMSGTNPAGGIFYINPQLTTTFIGAVDAKTVAYSLSGADPAKLMLVSGMINTYTGQTNIEEISYFTAKPEIIMLWSDINLAMNAYDNFSSGIFYTILNGDDFIQGNSFNDYIKGGKGNDIIEGKGGIDTAAFSGYRSEYRVEQYNGNTFVTDMVYSRDGLDMLNGVERIDFNDGILVFDVANTADHNLVYRLYQSAFARTPDEGGFRFWSDVKDKGASINSIASSFRGSAEFTQKYGANLANNDYVHTLYKNVLGREPDAAGLKFWQDSLHSNSINRDDALINFANSAENVKLTEHNVDNGYWLI